REKPRIAMKEPVGAAGRRADITVAVENEEGIVVLEGAARARRRARRRNVERRLGNNFERQFREGGAHTRHESPVSSCPFPAPAAASARRSRAPAAPPACAANGTHEHSPWPCAQRKSAGRIAAAPRADRARAPAAAS